MNNLPENGPLKPGSEQENAWISNVLDQHGDRALTFALRIVGQSRDAEDVLQESLVKLICVARKKPIENPAAYLNAVIKTTALDILAKRKTEKLPPKPPDNNPSQDHTDPSGPMQRLEFSAKLDQALSQMNLRLAKTVIGRGLCGQSYAELAQEMHVTCRTARSYYWLALEKLREFFSLD